MKPYYFRSGFRDTALDDVLHSTPWIQVTDARLECFMSAATGTYTYGEGRGVRTYTPVPYSSLVLDIQHQLNRDDIGGLDGAMRDVFTYNVCFLNRYDNASMQLGWHSDDSPGMDHEHPIAVVSFGQPREIWWRERGQTGIIPADPEIRKRRLAAQTYPEIQAKGLDFINLVILNDSPTKIHQK
jgi:alkylated DNA repair dioxygenase AlkB